MPYPGTFPSSVYPSLLKTASAWLPLSVSSNYKDKVSAMLFLSCFENEQYKSSSGWIRSATYQ